jgi:hypothetical protein
MIKKSPWRNFNIGTQKAADSRLQILLEFAGGCPPPSIDNPKGLHVDYYKINS